jgi:D-alanyl-D-alanine carboxypeptidase
MVPATRPGYRAQVMAPRRSRPGRVSPGAPATPLARRRFAPGRRALIVGAALSLLMAAVGPVPAARAVDPDQLLARKVGEGVRPPSPPNMRDTLQRRLDRLRVRDGIPGVSVAILFPDGTTWVGTSGLANVRTGEAVEPDTAFAIASISKTFTSALIMALSEEGAVDLGSPVARYLPELSVDGRVTVRMLLDHTSGLRDFFLDPRIDKALLADRGRTWDARRSLRYVGRPYFKPGKGWHYSNTNYLLLGLIAERVGGRSLSAQLRARFFEPLELDHTFEQIHGSPAGPVAHGYRFDGASTKLRPVDLSDGTDMAPFTSVVTAAGAAGSIASTPTDLVHWVRALYGGDVLDPDTLSAMVGDVALTAAKDATIPYGLGVQAVAFDGHPTLGHSGRLLGFRAVVRWLPRERIAIAVVTNQSRSDPSVIARSMLRLALLRAMGGCLTCQDPL